VFIKGTAQQTITWVNSSINQKHMTCHCSDGFFKKFKGPSLFKKRARVFSVKRHFVVECSFNVKSAANVCGSRATQAAIKVIAACVVPLPLL
jgi:hypothetical protein